MRQEWKEMGEIKLNFNQSQTESVTIFRFRVQMKRRAFGTTSRYDTTECEKLSSYLLSSQRIFFARSFPQSQFNGCSISNTVLPCFTLRRMLDQHWNNVNDSFKRRRNVFSSYLGWILVVNTTEWITKQVGHWDALHDHVKNVTKKKKCEWTFCWANELNKWKRVIKASKCERFVGLFEIVHRMHIFLSLSFSLHCNQIKWDLDTVG